MGFMRLLQLAIASSKVAGLKLADCVQAGMCIVSETVLCQVIGFSHVNRKGRPSNSPSVTKCSHSWKGSMICVRSLLWVR